MPTVTKTGNYHVPAHPANRWFITLNGVRVYIYQAKIDKHALGSFWPQAEGTHHTGVAAVDGDEEIKMYVQFASDFDYAFQHRESRGLNTNSEWIELEYQEKELQAQLMGVDVGTREFFQFRGLKVGASVQRIENTIAVHINHGPYPTGRYY